MKKSNKFCIILASSFCFASPFALLAADEPKDDPNAQLTAETARINAEAAKINAEAALAKAKADKEKAAIENIGLPKFDNKTTLGEGGGAIETSMLATRAVREAAITIKGKIPGVDACSSGDFIVLPAGASFNPNLDTTLKKQAEALTDQIAEAHTPGPGQSALATGITIASAIAGLIGNEVSVTGIGLTEIDNSMLANAVAGELGDCAVLAGTATPMIDPDQSALATAIKDLATERVKAKAWVKSLNKADKKKHADRIAALALLEEESAAFVKLLSTANDQGVNLLEKAMIVELLKKTATHVVTIKVNKAGGTITNSKNIGTFFGGDPVRVSGGLSASWSIMNLASGRNAGSGVVTCQTAQVRLKRVQSGEWTETTPQKKGAICS